MNLISVPTSVLDVLSDPYPGAVARVQDAANLAEIQEAERLLALRVRDEGRIGFVRDMLPLRDALRLMSCISGEPFGAHDLWLDRNDVAKRIGRSVQHVSYLIRATETFTVLYRPALTNTGKQAWVRADSVNRVAAIDRPHRETRPRRRRQSA